MDSDKEDEEAFLIDQNKDFNPKTHHGGWQTILGFVITAGVALVAGVFLERYLFLKQDWMCTAHVSQDSKAKDQHRANLITNG